VSKWTKKGGGGWQYTGELQTIFRKQAGSFNGGSGSGPTGVEQNNRAERKRMEFSPLTFSSEGN